MTIYQGKKWRVVEVLTPGWRPEYQVEWLADWNGPDAWIPGIIYPTKDGAVEFVQQREQAA